MAVRKKRSEEARLFFKKKHGTTVVEMVKRSTIGEYGTIVVAHLSFHAVFARVLLSVRAHLFHADRLRFRFRDCRLHRGDAGSRARVCEYAYVAFSGNCKLSYKDTGRITVSSHKKSSQPRLCDAESR